MFAHIKNVKTASLALLAVSATAYGTASVADGFQTRYGSAACNYTVDDSQSDKHMEFYGETDTFNDAANIGFRYVIQLGKKAPINNNCDDLHRRTVRAMDMDLEQKRLELELLQLEIDKLSETNEPSSFEDW